jgi:hypothetical protein
VVEEAHIIKGLSLYVHAKAHSSRYLRILFSDIFSISSENESSENPSGRGLFSRNFGTEQIVPLLSGE